MAACGLIYELVAGAVSSYLLGDAVTQFSLVIGVFLSAMGLGSFLARFIHRRLLETFVEVEIWLGLVGGLSSLAMFAVSAYAGPVFPVFFYALCAVIGTLVGIEIPLLVRILREGGGLSAALSNVLALDYLGALAAAILFPFVVLPLVGLSRASVLFGLMNLAVAFAGIRLLPGRRAFTLARAGVVTLLLLGALAASGSLVGFLEDVHYQDDVVYAKDSAYQRVVLTRWRDDLRLYLNGNLQFSSVDEARYHEALVVPAMESHPQPRQVLILGGGDGLAAREVLKYAHVEHVTVVDIDPVVTTLSRERRELRALNGDSFRDARVEVVNDDALLFLERDSTFYDVILADLPDPNSETLAKLYSTSFYALVARHLSAGGIFVTQATSPFFAPKAFWCILATLEAAVPPGGAPPLRAVPYHVNVPSFGEWGFVMAARVELAVDTLRPSVPTRFLTGEVLRAMFAFGKDLRLPETPTVNRLDDPVLFQYYEAGWRYYNE